MIDRVIRVLLVDDDEDDYKMFKELISEISSPKIAVEWASSYENGKTALARRAHDVCFLDFRLGGKTGIDILRESAAAGIKTPMILLTGYGEHEVDLEAMRLGAADYLVKDQVTPHLIERSIRYSDRKSTRLNSSH